MGKVMHFVASDGELTVTNYMFVDGPINEDEFIYLAKTIYKQLKIGSLYNDLDIRINALEAEEQKIDLVIDDVLWSKKTKKKKDSGE